MPIRCVISLAVFLLAIPAMAQLSPPPGWTQDWNKNGLVFEAPPAKDGSRVIYNIFWAQNSSKPLAGWFDAQIKAIAFGQLSLVKRHGIVMQGDIAVDAFELHMTAGREARPYAYVQALAAATPQGHQMFLVLSPGTWQEPNSGHADEALAHAARLIATRFALVPSTQPSAQKPAAARPAAAAPGVTSKTANAGGKKPCRNEWQWRSTNRFTLCGLTGGNGGCAGT